jgi:hypothetical protein
MAPQRTAHIAPRAARAILALALFLGLAPALYLAAAPGPRRRLPGHFHRR